MRIHSFLDEIQWRLALLNEMKHCRPIRKHSKTEFWVVLILLCLIGITVHIIVAIGGHIVLTGDSGSYLTISREIEDGSFKLDNLALERVPGYGLFIYVIQKIFGQHSSIGLKLIQHFLGFIVNVLIFFCALIISKERLYFSFTAALCSNLSLQVVSFQNWVMTETLYMFILMSCILVYLNAITFRKDYLFFISILLCAMMAWIRPNSRLFMIALSGFWILNFFCCILKDSKGFAMDHRMGFIITRIKQRKPWGWFLGGIIVYIILISPLLLSNYRRMGKLTLGSGEGIALWHGVYTYQQIEHLDNPEFKQFLTDFNHWANYGKDVPKIFLDNNLDWRHNYFVYAYNYYAKKMKPHEASNWMLKMGKDAIAHNKLKYLINVLHCIYPQLTAYEKGTFLFENTCELLYQYTWSIDLFNMNNQYAHMQFITRYFELHEQISVFTPFYSVMCGLYNRYCLNKNQQFYIFLLIIMGFFAGFLFFQPMGYLLILGILCYHIILPLFILEAFARFRYPVHGFLLYLIVAGPWYLFVCIYDKYFFIMNMKMQLHDRRLIDLIRS
ncbi:MAG: hypothetical protein HQK77_04330 [Desulfobacterales bacterium]|nr:hypothetical protein [Desulfobacterales bacterium]